MEIVCQHTLHPSGHIFGRKIICSKYSSCWGYRIRASGSELRWNNPSRRWWNSFDEASTCSERRGKTSILPVRFDQQPQGSSDRDPWPRPRGHSDRMFQTLILIWIRRDSTVDWLRLFSLSARPDGFCYRRNVVSALYRLDNRMLRTFSLVDVSAVRRKEHCGEKIKVFKAVALSI